MEAQTSNDPATLSLFFTEEIFVVPEPVQQHAVERASESPVAQVSLPDAASGTPAAPAVPAAEIPLVEPVVPRPAAVTSVAAPAPRSFSFVGKNERKVVILVNDPVHEVSTEAGRELLRKIVKSVNLSGNDFALLNHARTPDATFQEYAAFFKGCTFLIFGATAQALGAGEMPLHQATQLEGHQVVFTLELDALQTDAQVKKQLWATLQRINFLIDED